MGRQPEKLPVSVEYVKYSIKVKTSEEKRAEPEWRSLPFERM